MFLYAILFGAGLIVVALLRDDTGGGVSNKALMGIGFLIVALFVLGGGVLPLGPLGL
ncbi:MAG TPA: hypothetical protein VK821_00705 [Dehalococcoidia bacterium]|nr:hypothetical protein [Dehalococcoidia bacterium]